MLPAVAWMYRRGHRKGQKFLVGFRYQNKEEKRYGFFRKTTNLTKGKGSDAGATDNQFGKGCSEYVAHAIQNYYGE